jgi:predicted ATPase
VPLQAVRDPGHVIGTIARLLGLFDGEGDLEERLVAHIEDRQLLLVLDNFEQVVDAAPSVASVVAASPGLKVAVTTRTRLRVRGEQELPLAPLARGDSVSLFLERARAVRPDFEADTTDLETIAEICGHLDDLPLAIELAATRVKVLSPSTMLSRLDHRLELLTSRLRDAPSRHQALRDAIGWSVELLDDDEERVLFRRFSVFVGGSTLDAVEDVCGGELDELGSLVDKSLIRVDGERFGMLETIREYAGKALFREALAVYKGLTCPAALRAEPRALPAARRLPWSRARALRSGRDETNRRTRRSTIVRRREPRHPALGRRPSRLRQDALERRGHQCRPR